MINTDFITEFNNILLYKKDISGKEEGLYVLYNNDIIENKKWLVMGFIEYQRGFFDKSEPFIKIYYICLFIQFLCKKNCFHDNDLKNLLENTLKDYDISNLEHYSCFLETLFFIDNNNKIFGCEFDRLEGIVELSDYKDILKIFFNIFKENKNHDYILKTFELLLKNPECFTYDEIEGYDYFCNLKQSDFEKIFLQFLKDLFSFSERSKIKNYQSTYNGIVSLSLKDIQNSDGLYLGYKNILDKLIKKIIQLNGDQLKIIKEFLLGELFLLANNAGNLIENYYFQSLLFDKLKENDNNLIIEFLKFAKEKDNLAVVSWHAFTFILNNLNTDNIQQCIDIFYNEHDKNLFFNFYKKLDGKILKNVQPKNEEYFKYLDNIKNEQEKDNLKWEQERQEKIYQEKDTLIKLSEINNEGDWSPGFLQEYIKYLKSESFNDLGINESEKKELDEKIKTHVLNCLDSIYIQNYEKNNDIIINKLVYAKVGENGGYSVSWYVHYLNRCLNLSKKLNININKYYKSYVVFYPLFFGDSLEQDVLNLLEGNISSDDINFLLKEYMEDISENAKGLRFYNPISLCHFYNRFSRKFTRKQKKVLKGILLGFIQAENIQFKDSFLDIYASIVSKYRFKKLCHEPNLNYFQDILSDSNNISENEKEGFIFQIKVNKLLITYFNDKNAVLRRINQIKTGAVEYKDEFEIKYPRTFGIGHGISPLENELKFWFEEDNFGYVIPLTKRNINNEMLDLLEHCFKLEQNENYSTYCKYIKTLFFKYINDSNYKSKNFGKSIIKLFNKYNKGHLDFNINYVYDIFGLGHNEHFISNNYPKFDASKFTLIAHEDFIEYQYLKTWNKNGNKEHILFVEGESDKIHLESAWNRLYPNKAMNFEIIVAYGWHILEATIKDNQFMKKMAQNGIIIGLIDFDDAYKTYENMDSQKWPEVVDNEYLGLLKKHTKENKYLLVLPVPKSRKEYASKIFGQNSLLSIEFLFEDKYVSDYVKKIDNIPGSQYGSLYKFVGDKIKFAKKMSKKSTIEDGVYENFIPLFQQIEDIINGKYKQNDM